jgi:hypothetical protein
MATEYLTEDKRCGKCGEPLTNVEVERVGMGDWGHGYLEPLAMAYTLKPCGHTYSERVLDFGGERRG